MAGDVMIVRGVVEHVVNDDWGGQRKSDGSVPPLQARRVVYFSSGFGRAPTAVLATDRFVLWAEGLQEGTGEVVEVEVEAVSYANTREIKRTVCGVPGWTFGAAASVAGNGSV